MSGIWFGVLVFAGLVVVLVVARQNILDRRKKKELAQREAELAQYKEELTDRFGPEYARLILDGDIQQGMTKEMLLESLGEPDDVDEEQVRSKIRQTWKYDQVGLNRYENRVHLENDVVVGYKGRRWIHR